MLDGALEAGGSLKDALTYGPFAREIIIREIARLLSCMVCCLLGLIVSEYFAKVGAMCGKLRFGRGLLMDSGEFAAHKQSMLPRYVPVFAIQLPEEKFLSYSRAQRYRGLYHDLERLLCGFPASRFAPHGCLLCQQQFRSWLKHLD